jgi:hypothetical protein
MVSDARLVLKIAPASLKMLKKTQQIPRKRRSKIQIGTEIPLPRGSMEEDQLSGELHPDIWNVFSLLFNT